MAADAADPEAVASSVRAAAAHLGGLDVLVNNAGVGVTARLIDTPLADYDRVMNVNVRGCLLYAQHAYPHLARNRGCMIHIASDAGIWGEQATGLYSVTKAAVVMLGKMLALDGGPDGVRSNVLCPGDIWPGMRHMAPPGEQDRAESGDDWPVPPIGRIGQAGDVAAAAVFYASGQAEFITGTTLLVDGGMTAGYLQRERGADSPPARRLPGSGVTGAGGLQRGGGGRGGQRRRVDERAAGRAGLHRLVQGAALQVLGPAEEPLGPAVVPGTRPRAAHDRDGVAGHREVVVRLARRRATGSRSRG